MTWPLVQLLALTFLFLCRHAVEAQTCLLPCLPCSNNATCDHATQYIHTDGQVFGKCVCPTNYTGPQCASYVNSTCSTTCHHQSTCIGSQCSCNQEFTGTSCFDPVCFHQVGGVGALSVAAPNSLGLCGPCMSGYTDPFCYSPAAQSSCPSGTTYTTSLWSSAKTMRFFCESHDVSWTSINNGVPNMMVSCSKPSGWNTTGTHDGICMVRFNRVSAVSNRMEETFYCDFTSCDATAYFEGDSSTTQYYALGDTKRDFSEPAGAAALRYLLVIAAAFTGIVVLVPSPHKTVIIFASISVVVLLIALNMGVSSKLNENDNKHNKTISQATAGADALVDLTCLQSQCYCNYNSQDLPNCQIAQMSGLVEGLKRKLTFHCNNHTGDCKFTHEDLLGGAFDILMQCTAHDCVTNFPLPVTTSRLSTKHSDNTLPIIVGVVAAAFVAVVLASFGWHFYALQQAQKKWDESAFAKGNSLASSDVAPENDANGKILPSPCSKANNKLIVELRNISYEVSLRNSTRRVVDNVSSFFSAGSIVAIMGPSGSGKTSLLDILCGREKPGEVSGKVLVHTPACTTVVEPSNLETFKRFVGYVADDDAVLPSLTVIQAMRFTAALRLPCFISNEKKEAFLQVLITTFQLQACVDTVVGISGATDSYRGGLSQGERRRVAIALHLIAMPRVLVLDEPTTGLDSYNARLVIQCLHDATKALEDASANVLGSLCPNFFNYHPAVVLTIHQPSPDMLCHFDRILLLARGLLIYDGPSTGPELESWISTTRRKPIDGEKGKLADPDMMLEIASTLPDSAYDEIRSKQLSSGDQQHVNVAAVLAKSPSGNEALPQDIFVRVEDERCYYPLFWTQVRILLYRGWGHLMGLKAPIALHFLISTLITLLISFVYNNSDMDIPGTLNKAGAITFYLLWISIVNLSALDLILAERATYVFERHSTCYGSFAYFTSKIIIDYLLLRVLPIVVGGCIMYFPIGLRPTVHAFLLFLLISGIFSVATAALGTCIACLVPTFGVGLLCEGFMTIVFFAFGGFMSQTDVMPASLRWIRFLSPFYYAFEYVMITDLKGETCFFAPRDSAGDPISMSLPLQCEQYLFNIGLKPQNNSRDISLLAVWAAAYLVLSYVCLALFVRGKR